MQGDPLVDRLMKPVVAALMRHGIKGDAKTDIYNRAYEAVMNSMDVKTGKTYCAYCGTEYPLDDNAATQVSEHIKMCEQHPMRALESALAEANRRADGLDTMVQMYGNMIAAKDSMINNQEHLLRWRKLNDEPPPIYVFVETLDFDGDIQMDYFSEKNEFLSKNDVLYWRFVEFPDDFYSGDE